MILHLDPQTPAILRAAATGILYLHIGAGCVGLASGATALLARKGGWLHRVSGNVFFGAMLTMAGVGAAVAPFLPQMASAIAGIFTLYLITTGWMTVRRPAGAVGRFEVGAFVTALCVLVGNLILGFVGMNSPHGMIQGVPYQPAFVFAALAALSAGLDLRVLLRRGISGGQRLARHLWRMFTGLFIASASLFLGQAQVFPRFMRNLPLLALPEVLILIALAYWLWRVRERRPAAQRPRLSFRPRAISQ